MLGRRALASLLLGLAALPKVAEAAVTGATLEADGPVTRLTLAVPEGAAWRVRAARRPNRLLVELPGQSWRIRATLPGAGRVRAARLERGRLRLDLSAPVALHGAASSGGRLVIELTPGTAAGFARLAAGGRAVAQSGGRAVAESGGRAVAESSGRTVAESSGRTVAERGGRAGAGGRAALPLVVLDPGHGGRDPGAIGTQGTQEKRVVLAAAQVLKRVLESGGRCRVAMTRSSDRFVALADRVEFARRREAALFVSLHADSAPGARGASVYTLGESSDQLAGALARRENQADRAGGLRLPSVPPEVQAILLSLVRAETRIGSARMAQQVVSALRPDVPLLPNTHRQAGFLVLKAPDVPAVLVEMGFLSDRRDEAALRRPEHRAKLATALGRAIHGWLDQRQHTGHRMEEGLG